MEVQHQLKQQMCDCELHRLAKSMCEWCLDSARNYLFALEYLTLSGLRERNGNKVNR